MGLPDWTTRWFLESAIIGFPFGIAFAWFYELTPTGLKRESEIAPEESIFVDGMSEELISDLIQINGLKVIGKDSSFKFRDSKDSPAQIGAALGVSHLIQGSVFQEGNNIRVTVLLIRAKDGTGCGHTPTTNR